MKIKINKEELQSRREFFKEAARKSLPIIGAIVLAGSPIVAHATGSESMRCGGNSCESLCRNTCTLTCATNCREGCKTSCEGSCKGCRNTCSGGCKGSSRYVDR